MKIFKLFNPFDDKTKIMKNCKNVLNYLIHIFDLFVQS